MLGAFARRVRLAGDTDYDEDLFNPSAAAAAPPTSPSCPSAPPSRAGSWHRCTGIPPGPCAAILTRRPPHPCQTRGHLSTHRRKPRRPCRRAHRRPRRRRPRRRRVRRRGTRRHRHGLTRPPAAPEGHSAQDSRQPRVPGHLRCLRSLSYAPSPAVLRFHDWPPACRRPQPPPARSGPKSDPPLPVASFLTYDLHRARIPFWLGA